VSETQKDGLRYYLQRARDALVWKLDGLSDYDVRRPLVPTGTNLLGLIKHVAGVEAGYFGPVFGRPMAEPMPWDGVTDDDSNIDMWATADESRADILELYRMVRGHADDTIEALELDTPGLVPWWPADRRNATLNRVLVHVIGELHRHAGHADIVREMIDGSVGVAAAFSNLPEHDQAWWRDYHAKLERVARQASNR
jgi:hypothetical protein